MNIDWRSSGYPDSFDLKDMNKETPELSAQPGSTYEQSLRSSAGLRLRLHLGLHGAPCGVSSPSCIRACRAAALGLRWNLESGSCTPEICNGDTIHTCQPEAFVEASEMRRNVHPTAYRGKHSVHRIRARWIFERRIPSPDGGPSVAVCRFLVFSVWALDLKLKTCSCSYGLCKFVAYRIHYLAAPAEKSEIEPVLAPGPLTNLSDALLSARSADVLRIPLRAGYPGLKLFLHTAWVLDSGAAYKGVNVS
ncbi:hypothetical protein B0H15DRAFT_431430 [Mycena belliarum]|uniref:Uncharacterized protein n=1 Tax=Mycena belliarum TaxID=1033014 RepID=A0AAD6U2V9_9AGAR|nr:hypothetical protein B0H15DRAFT_431430 [Mycena belliae]